MQLSALRILVVDDDESIRAVVQELLISEGYEVRVAPHGLVALRLIEETPPDLILLDLLMPIMDGREFAQAYRALPGPHAPIILLTATFDSEASALLMSADGYLDKPFLVEELLELLHQTLERAASKPPCV
jgi:two-component system chemotaxis response regulator CheY